MSFSHGILFTKICVGITCCYSQSKGALSQRVIFRFHELFLIIKIISVHCENILERVKKFK